MKNLKLVVCFVATIFVSVLICPLHAYLSYSFYVDSASNTEVFSRLVITNHGTNTYNTEFPASPFCGIQINQVIQYWAYFPVITPFTLGPGESYTENIYNEVDLANGVYSMQAVLWTSDGYIAVGNMVWVYVPTLHPLDMDYTLLIDNLSEESLDMRLVITNNQSSPWSYIFGVYPFIRFSINGEMITQESAQVMTELALYPGQSTQFPIHYEAQFTPGIYSFQAFLDWNSTSDYLPVGDPVEVEVFAVVEHTIGIGNIMERIPIDFYYRNSLYQCIYTEAELDGMAGIIRELAFYSNFPYTNLAQIPTKIFLATTTLQDLSQGWISANDMTLVFDGEIDYPAGNSRIDIELQTPFALPVNRNLVLMVQRPWTNVMMSANYPFYSQSCAPANARRATSDVYSLDPYSPPSATESQLIAKTPRTTFTFTPGDVSVNDSIVTTPDLPHITSYPNPFNPQTTISFELLNPAFTKLSVYNLKGQIVTTLVQDHLPIGMHTAVWNATTESGKSLSSGIYLVRLQSGSHTSTTKVMLMK